MITKEERAELRNDALYRDPISCDLVLEVCDALDAADERIAGLEAEVAGLKATISDLFGDVEVRNCKDSNHGLTMDHQCVSCMRIENGDERIAQLESWGREDCEPLKARIAELEAAAQWRPVEEAPRDESRVLVGNGRNSPVFARFIDRQWRSDERLGIVRPSHYLAIPALPEGGV